MSLEAFAPIDGATVEINVAATTANILVREGQYNSDIDVRIMNNGSATVWLRAGTSAVEATTAHIPVGPGVTEVLKFAIPSTGRLYIAAIAAGSTGKIYFTPGDGI